MINKRHCLLFLFLLIVTICLFSLSLSEERILIMNLTDEDLIVNCEYKNIPLEAHLVQRINEIDVKITSWMKNEEVITKFCKDYHGVISYLPESDNWDDYYYLFDRLSELPLQEKMKSLFKTFSIRTTNGKYVVKDIDDLCNINIKKTGNIYVLEIHNVN